MRTVGRLFCAHTVPDDKMATNMQTIIKPIIEPPLSCAVVAAIRRNCQADGIGATHFAVFVLSATENKSNLAVGYPNATKGRNHATSCEKARCSRTKRRPHRRRRPRLDGVGQRI